jgi:hypothetical protein
MGIIQHDAVLVTFSDYAESRGTFELDKLRSLLPVEVAHLLSVTNAVSNGYRTLFFAPDGSKEGWETSQDGDEARDIIRQYCEETLPYCDIILVSYGELGNRIQGGFEIDIY